MTMTRWNKTTLTVGGGLLKYKVSLPLGTTIGNTFINTTKNKTTPLMHYCNEKDNTLNKNTHGHNMVRNLIVSIVLRPLTRRHPPRSQTLGIKNEYQWRVLLNNNNNIMTCMYEGNHYNNLLPWTHQAIFVNSGYNNQKQLYWVKSLLWDGKYLVSMITLCYDLLYHQHHPPYMTVALLLPPFHLRLTSNNAATMDHLLQQMD
ncbi:hypothetical protein BC941DRAFT_428601 [Chlamydoabsidia padenii]|nr:hypothetical protein BC941DRAFT_428601 [Chlamydoabsidia padenii]